MSGEWLNLKQISCAEVINNRCLIDTGLKVLFGVEFILVTVQTEMIRKPLQWGKALPADTYRKAHGLSLGAEPVCHPTTG